MDLFDTTQYGDGRLSSPQSRTKYLQYRNVFSDKNLALLEPEAMERDFREKIESFRPDFLIYSFTSRLASI